MSSSPPTLNFTERYVGIKLRPHPEIARGSGVMSFPLSLRSTAAILFITWRIAAAPQQILYPASLNSSSPLSFLDVPTTDIHPSINQVSTSTNDSTAAGGLNDDNRDIFCLKGQTKRPITVDSCRPTLNYLKQFPNFAARQSFLITAPREGRTILGIPHLPHVYNGVIMPDGPPFVIQTENGDCVIRVQVDNIQGTVFGIEAKFSWRDVRATATQIIEHCDEGEENGNGLRRIGFPERPLGAPGWVVYAVGKPWGSPLGNVSASAGEGSVELIAEQQSVPVETT